MFTLPASIRRGARLDAVVHAVAAASGRTRLIYVERRGNTFRWSPAHRGGPYPLMRETAKVLGIDFHEFILPFRKLGATGLTLIPNEGSQTADQLEFWALLEFESAEPAEAVRARICAAVGAPES